MSGCMRMVGVVASLLLFSGTSISLADSPPTESTADLQLQISALRTIDELHLTPEQVRSLQTLANGAGDPTFVEPAQSAGNDAYHHALLDLRDALASGDEAHIAQARVQAEKAAAGANAAPPAVNLSDVARQNAYPVVLILSTSQYANFVALHAGEISDAADVLIHALDECRQGNQSDFVATRDHVASEVGALLFGVSDQPRPKWVEHVKNLLNRTRKMSDDEFQSERTDLNQTARSLLAARLAHPDEELRHWFEGQMAQLLSNPQLPAALAERIRVSHEVETRNPKPE